VIYLDANVVENCKQMDKLEAVDFSMVDLQMITDIASQDNLFSLIVNSLCPTIFGHQLVKGTVQHAALFCVHRPSLTAHCLGLCPQRALCWPCLPERGEATTKTRYLFEVTLTCSSWAIPVLPANRKGLCQAQGLITAHVVRSGQVTASSGREQCCSSRGLRMRIVLIIVRSDGYFVQGEGFR
jgi:hypothetical protein